MFATLAHRGHIDIMVFYTWGEKVMEEKFDPGFGKSIQWDIPLLEGYQYRFVKNISATPGSKSYKGIDNPTLNKEIAQWGADAVLVYGWNFRSHLAALRYFHGKIPVFFRGDSTLLGKTGKLKGFIKSILLRWVYNKVDTAFYVGRFNKAYFEAYGMPAKKLVFAPHAIDNNRFADQHERLLEQAAEERRSMNIPVDALVMVYAGKLEPVKNVGLLVAAAKRLQDKNIHFIVAGNGELETSLKSAATEKVHFSGFRNQQDMPLLYRLGQVFVLPSKSETWGLGINEAMACRRAILASDACGAAADLVENGRNGFTFRCGSEDDLVAKISLLYEDESLTREMGEESFKKIRSWSYISVAEAFENRVQHV